MRTLLSILTLILLLSNLSFSLNDEFGHAEIIIRNNSGIPSELAVKVFPVGAIYEAVVGV